MAKNTNKPPSLPLPGQRLGPSGLVERFIINVPKNEKRIILHKNNFEKVIKIVDKVVDINLIKPSRK